MGQFQLKSNYVLMGDQPTAVNELVKSILAGNRYQTLLGVTGSGKTFTMANVIEKLQRPTLVIAHNKTLAAQLCAEFKEFFPNNAVEYFVSYYDYYQPEAYIAHTDTYIAKDASINQEIEKLRHSATAALFERRDVIIVASVSAIYGLGDPSEYLGLSVSLRPGQEMKREILLRRLVDIQYNRNEMDFARGSFRAKGDVVEIIPAGESEQALRVEFFGDEIERIAEIDTLTGQVLGWQKHVLIFPASHYVTAPEKLALAMASIEAELAEELTKLRANGKLLEAQRLEQRTKFDLEMMAEVGYCQGIENYSRHLLGQPAGSSPFTLLDYFPEDYLIMIDESHATLPQLGAMYKGDRARKENLVAYGFRLPSAIDNRPLKFAEFEEKAKQLLYVSATPGPYELEHSNCIVEQVVRPTGLLDPPIEVRPSKNQIDDLIGEINQTVAKGFRVLITTLTKRMAEDLTTYLNQAGIKVRYLHSEVKTLERMAIVRDLRLGEFDVLVGINLLREGLDLPEVALVAILDADKEGFLRSERSLIQTIGRAARNVAGRVIMYGDHITESMRRAIQETNRRRTKQDIYNQKHNITPQTIQKEVRDVIAAVLPTDKKTGPDLQPGKMSKKAKEQLLRSLAKEMQQAAKRLDFEEAAELRDLIMEIRLAGVKQG